MALAADDRLQEAVYKALRIVEDTDLPGDDLARAIELAEELVAELKRLRARLAS